MWVSLRLSLILIKLEYQDSVGISTPVPQSNQNKYQDSVGISTLVPQSVKLNTRIVWVSLRLFLNLVTYQDSVGISTLVPQSSQTKYQDSVGISTLVPQSSQT